MTREERLKRLSAFFRDFARLLEEIPMDEREAVRKPFCEAMGAYLAAVERGKCEIFGQVHDGD